MENNRDRLAGQPHARLFDDAPTMGQATWIAHMVAQMGCKAPVRAPDRFGNGAGKRFVKAVKGRVLRAA